jgi:UDP-glucuronate 4-epimerase
MRRTWADVGKAMRIFGYRPATDFDEGLRRFAVWLRAEIAAESKTPR